MAGINFTSNTESPLGQSGHFACDNEIWNSLKFAIASSSGFQRWQLERLHSSVEFREMKLEEQVQKYLRETLETLAY